LKVLHPHLHPSYLLDIDSGFHKDIWFAGAFPGKAASVGRFLDTASGWRRQEGRGTIMRSTEGCFKRRNDHSCTV
jgi:hypothetical protein